MSRRRDGEIAWAEIQAKFERGASINALSKEYKCARATITWRSKRDEWKKCESLAEVAHDQVRATVIDLTTRKAIEMLGGDAAITRHAEMLAEELRQQGPLFRKMTKLLHRTIDRALNLGTENSDRLILGPTQGETQAVADLFTALSKYIRDGRLAHGIADGTPTIPREDEESPKAEGIVLVVRDSAQQTA